MLGDGPQAAIQEPQSNSPGAQPIAVSAAPEPAAWALMLAGFLGSGVALRRVRRFPAAV